MNIKFALTWYIASIFTLLFSILMLINLSFVRTTNVPMQPHYQLYKALPTSVIAGTAQEVVIGKDDGRKIIITNFFEDHHSPLISEADKFIEVADLYKIDYRLLPSIAMQESNGGKIMPKNSFNPFGYGIYGGQVLKFDSFEQAIERVGMGLKKDYIDLGLTEPYQIMAKYTPPSLQKGGAWAIGVSAFMEQLR